MKKLTFLLLCFGINFLLFAQPSDSEVVKRAKGEGAIETRFTGDHGNVHTSLTEKWYMRTMESRWKTDYPDIYRWERNEYRYNYIGGKWVYARTLRNSTWYDGIPNPTEEEIMENIYKDLPRFLMNRYYSGLGDLPKIKLYKDPRWEWHTMNSVSFNVEYEFLHAINNSEIQRENTVARVRFYRNTGDGKHDPNIHKLLDTEWLPGGHSSKIDNLSTVIETKKISAEQMNSLQTYHEIDLELKAEKRLEELGDIEIPEFSSDKQFIAYVLKMMHEADSKELELFFRKTLIPHYYTRNSKITLTENGENFVKTQVQKQKQFKEMFCEHPIVAEQQYGTMQFFDRANQTKLRVVVHKNKEGWKLGTFDWYSKGGDYLTAAKRAGDANCSSTTTIIEEKPLDRYNVGDKVTVNWNGQGKEYYNGTVTKHDPYDKDRYFIEFEKINSAWIHAKHMSQQRGLMSIGGNNNNNNSSSSGSSDIKEKGKGIVKGLLKNVK